MDRGVRLFVRSSVNINGLYVSFLDSCPTNLELHRIVRDMCPYSRSVSDFAISGHVTPRLVKVTFLYLLFYWAEYRMSARGYALHSVCTQYPFFPFLIRLCNRVGTVMALEEGGRGFQSHSGSNFFFFLHQLIIAECSS